MLRDILWYIIAWIPFVGRYFSLSAAPANKDLDKELPPARVAIIGAGVGGCFSAKFLRELGGNDLDIHVWNKKESTIGGRTATIQLDGHLYEAGACVIHSSNKYLADAAMKHGLKIKRRLGSRATRGVYNGITFVFRTGTSKTITVLKVIWQYGLSIIRMIFSVKGMLKKFESIYRLQANGESYASVSDLLKAMDQGGDALYSLTRVSAREHFTKLGWSEKLIDELITPAMRSVYAQSCTVNAFCANWALACLYNGTIWSVLGGNRQIPETVLEASGATLHKDDVTTVTRVDTDGKLKYKITTISGGESGDFDVVIVANPLNTSAVNYVDFPMSIYSTATTSPYQRSVVHFVKGRINKEFFHLSKADKNFPLIFITTEMKGAPFEFRTMDAQVPSEVPQEEMADYFRSYEEEPVRVWRFYAPVPLTEEQKKQMFTDIEDEATVDWLAFPKHNPPEHFPPFILDDGMFYINGVEKAASGMEMSAIGAKNVALLAREYLLRK